MDTDSVLSDIKSREKNLAPLYTQIAHEFADLHDRAGIYIYTYVYTYINT
jgi:acetyl-CoA carboxylase/biotin carboxylase 1